MSRIYTRGNCIYEGKANRVFEVKGDEKLLILERTDNVTAGNGKKKGTIPDKGTYNNKISNILFQAIEYEGVETHFVKELSDRETVVTRTRPIKLEVVVRNIATGSIIKRLPFDDGQEFKEPVFEIYYKDDSFGDPLINETEAAELGVLDCAYGPVSDYADIYSRAMAINATLQDIFNAINIILVDFKLEFGYDEDGEIILIDEVSPDTMRLWDKKTKKKLDKDRFRQSLGDEAAVYKEVYERLYGQK